MTFTLKIEQKHLQKTNTVAYTLNNIFSSLILTDINSEVKGQLSMSIYAQNVNIMKYVNASRRVLPARIKLKVDLLTIVVSEVVRDV